MQITVDSVSKSYDGVRVLSDVNLDIDDAHAITIVGPSGGGKTTLLRVLAGLEIPETGKVTINGRQIVYREEALRNYRKTIGMVFQSYNLFPHLTALENITLPLQKVHGLTAREAYGRATGLLQRFKLEEHGHKRPGQLSGGQKQRIALSRAMAINPEFLLLDEPTSALDPEFTSDVLDMIRELRQEDTHLILVTHHMGFARSVSDYIVFVADGGIAEQGPPAEVFDAPKNEQVKRFLAQVLKY
ncbi:MAG: amino acid ABC transporter ATP-binding protein [Spirochaetota bacterium]